MVRSDSDGVDNRASVSLPESAPSSGRTPEPEKTRRRHIHLSLDVVGALKHWKRGGREWEGVVTDPETGRVLTPQEFQNHLFEQLAQGVRRIPFESKTSRCEGFSPETGCPGHDVEDARS